jgi:hypothetical protein
MPVKIPLKIQISLEIQGQKWRGRIKATARGGARIKVCFEGEKTENLAGRARAC